MYYLDEINFVECETYEEAEESVMTAFDEDEIIDRAMMDRLHDVLNELRRLESPLYWELFETARDGFLNDYLTEMEGELEDE
jgi:predicted ATP-dependent Lon-type protease